MEEAEQDQGRSISTEEMLNQLHKLANGWRTIIRTGVCVYIAAEKWNDWFKPKATSDALQMDINNIKHNSHIISK